MHFCIVEKKDTDLFTIYDMENGGVCCCSKYTVLQLLDMGHTIYGVQKTAKGIGIVEVGLDGKPRQKKASVICTDTTKRSATTIAKGLSEKKYPRVKQNRSGVAGEVEPHVPLSLKDKDNKYYWGMLTKDKNVVFISTSPSALDTLRPAKSFKEYTVEEDMPPEMKSLLLQATEMAESYHHTMYEITMLKKRLEYLEQQKQQYGKYYTDISARFIKVKKDIAFDKTVATAMAKCNGTEQVSMKLGSGDKAFIIAVIKKTKRKILYTYGLGYRNPTTYKQPITKAQAIEYVKRGGLLDISSNDEMIHLNEYSGNDMW